MTGAHLTTDEQMAHLTGEDGKRPWSALKTPESGCRDLEGALGKGARERSHDKPGAAVCS